MVTQIPVGGYDKNFAYLISGSGGRCVIVDPSNVEMILEYLKMNGNRPEKIMLTHSHFDHTEGVEELVKIFGIPVFIHKKGIDRLGAQLQPIGLEDGDIITIEETEIKVLYTPGHIDDAVCLYIEDENIVITGDTVFVGGCGRADFENSNVNDLFNSIQRIKNLPDETIIYPGHDYGDKPTSTVKIEKEKNSYFLARDFGEFYRLRMR